MLVQHSTTVVAIRCPLLSYLYPHSPEQCGWVQKVEKLKSKKKSWKEYDTISLRNPVTCCWRKFGRERRTSKPLLELDLGNFIISVYSRSRIPVPCCLLKCCLGKKIWFSIKVESSFNHSSSLVAGKLLISWNLFNTHPNPLLDNALCWSGALLGGIVFHAVSCLFPFKVKF